MTLARIRARVLARLVQATTLDPNYFSIPTIEPEPTKQRWVGGSGANDNNDGVLVEYGGSGPWANFENALIEQCGLSSPDWSHININDDLSVGAIDTKYEGGGSGTLSNPVVVRPEPTLVSRPTLTLNGRMEIDGQDNWLWHGFHMAGAHGINLGEDISTKHQTFRNLTGMMSGNGGDNHGFLQALNRNTEYFGVFNCSFVAPGVGGSVHDNTSCVIALACRAFRWENIVATNCLRPFYQKHSNTIADGAAEIYIRNNYVPLTDGGENCFFSGRANGGIYEISNNIFESVVEISNGGGGAQPEGLQFLHNTCRQDVRVQNGNQPPINGTYRNNIFESDFNLLRYGETNTNTNLLENNLYGGNIYYNDSVFSTVPAWRAASVPANQDLNSLDGLPTYQEGANPTTIAGFGLTAASNGYQAGDNGANMGADVSLVGVM